MNTVVNLWIAAPVLGTALILQWAVLRTKYGHELTKQRDRHEQQQQTTTRDTEQAKWQIGKLQHDLVAATLQVKRSSTQSDSRIKDAVNRMLDDADALRRHLPTNDFADTQPSPHSQHDVDLLLR